MSPRIQILPEVLCNKIAAGEVVERPASVVKELVENAIDAGAGEIVVEVEKGGKSLVRVSDNGCGMGRDDVFLSLERHATSKISSDADLFQLRTLGFRGEALPSIAAVSRLLIRSRSVNEEAGWEIYLESGQVKRADPLGMATGTSVEVRDLFFKMPARRKFLRRDETELGHIGDVVTKLALARPEIGFKLLHHGRVLIEAFPGQSLQERVGSLLSRSLLRDLQPIEQRSDLLHIQGLIGIPGLNRSTTGFVYTFINGRYIRDRVVQHAVLEGYRTLLPRGRYPVVVLFLELDPEQVDVNVHPTKHEVRFRRQADIHDLLAETIRQQLRGSNWLVRPHAERDSDGHPSLQNGSATTVAREERSQAPRLAEQVAERVAAYTEETGLSAGGTTKERTSAAEQTSESPSPTTVSADLFSAAQGFFASLEILGQYHNSYLLCQDCHDLIVIDQHAAHERIGFERLKRQWQSGRIESQQLLFPCILELSFQEATQLQQQLGQLERFGFEIEPFGGNSFAVKGVPQLLRNRDAGSLVRDLIAELIDLGNSQRLTEAVDEILILLSCHGMIRANQSLNRPEIKALLDDLDGVDFSAQCPHGRPVMHRLTLTEMERFFKRG